MSELLVFPAGKHDDQVDTFGLIGRMLDDMIKAAEHREPRRMDEVHVLTTASAQ